jgi:hypothetical protein
MASFPDPEGVVVIGVVVGTGELVEERLLDGGGLLVGGVFP